MGSKQPEKFLVEFFAEWIRNENMRKRVLFKEKQEMIKWGLSAKQSQQLRSLDEKAIKDLMFEELTDPIRGLGIDLPAILAAFVKYPTKAPQGAAAGAAYEEGHTHVRGVIPEKIMKDVESVVIVLGHGWDNSLAIEFEETSGASPNQQGELIDVDSEINVWQRATVKVTLPKGTWRVVAKVPSNNTAPDSTEDVVLTVT